MARWTWPPVGIAAGSTKRSGSHRCERRNAFEHCVYASSMSTSTPSKGALPSTALGASNSSSTVIAARAEVAVSGGIAGGDADEGRALDEQAGHRVEAITDLGAGQWGGFADERAQLHLGADDPGRETVGGRDGHLFLWRLDR